MQAEAKRSARAQIPVPEICQLFSCSGAEVPQGVPGSGVPQELGWGASGAPQDEAGCSIMPQEEAGVSVPQELGSGAEPHEEPQAADGWNAFPLLQEAILANDILFTSHRSFQILISTNFTKTIRKGSSGTSKDSIDPQFREWHNERKRCRKDKKKLTMKMTNEELIQSCPVALTVSLLGSKWKLLIIRNLMARPWHYNELFRDLEGISRKVLSQSLSSMMEDGLVARREIDSNPVQVEYSLTDLGQSMRPIIQSMEDWGNRFKQIRISRADGEPGKKAE